MSDVKLVRLTTGEELVCNVVLKDGEYVMKDVSVLIPTPEGQIGMQQYMPYTNAVDKLSISERFVMFVTDPVESVLMNHQKMFQRIIAPEKKLIL